MTTNRDLKQLRAATGRPRAAVGFLTCERILRRWFALAASHAGFAGLPGNPICRPGHVICTVAEADAAEARTRKERVLTLDAKRARTNADLMPAYSLALQMVLRPSEVPALHAAIADRLAMNCLAASRFGSR